MQYDYNCMLILSYRPKASQLTHVRDYFFPISFKWYRQRQLPDRSSLYLFSNTTNYFNESRITRLISETAIWRKFTWHGHASH